MAISGNKLMSYHTDASSVGALYYKCSCKMKEGARR